MKEKINRGSDIVIYRTSDGQVQLDVHIEKETVWLNSSQMATLFGRDEKTIRKHINNAIKEELSDVVVVAKFATTTQHGAMEGKSQVPYLCIPTKPPKQESKDNACIVRDTAPRW
jgi:hypothetical protein